MSTLKQVAAAAKVHITTVAAVLNLAGGNTRVGEATRERILLEAGRLGYVRNESARRLRTGKSNTVGFIGGDLRNPFFSELASALERELAGHKLQLFISHVSGIQSESFSHYLDTFQQQTISKVIYWDETASTKALLTRPQMQLVPIGFTVRRRPGVWLDLEYAVREVVSYLIKRGCRRIGFYAPRGSQESPSVLVRQKVFLDECRKRRLPSPVCDFYEGESWDIEAAARGAQNLLARKPALDAFVGFNDVAALGLLLASGEYKSKPLVVCFDGTALARSWPGPPPLVDLKIAELARAAVSLIVAEKNSDTLRKEYWLRPELMD